MFPIRVRSSSGLVVSSSLHRSWLPFCLVALFVALVGHCSCRKPTPSSSELILFSTMGERPFEDYVYTIAPGNSHPETILIPNSRRSYLSPSANSLQGKMVVTVHEADDGGNVEDHL